MTRQQLNAIGLDDDAIRHRVSRGRLHRIHRGVYAVGRPPVTPLERSAAAWLACGPGAALSHGSAMTLWGFWKRWETPFEITVLSDRRPRGIRVHRSRALTRRDLTRQLGIVVTSPARTILDIAPRIKQASLTRVVNDALLSRHLRAAELADVVWRFRGHAGATLLESFVEDPSNPTRSGFEDEFPAFCERFGLPKPVINTHVCGYEVDALFPAEKLIVELDGWRYHSTRRSFEDDRNKDADTLASGHRTVRITRQRFEQQAEREAERLHTIIAARGSRGAT